MNFSQMLIESSLEKQEICPKCGASFTSLQDDLETAPLASYALDQALSIIMGCETCQIRFQKQLDTIKRLYEARRLGEKGIEFKEE